VTRSETLIIGAGPAGLASAACLRTHGLPFTLVEQSGAVGASWRRHYERLHLHTARQHSALPYLPFARGTPRYPSREDVIEYLETYARHFRIEPLFGFRVSGVRRDADGWVASAGTDRIQARRIIVATGINAVPYLPSWCGHERFRGEIIHSSDYRNGEPFSRRRVLVVGFGNSAGEIAVDLHSHGARVALAVRSTVNVVPRDLLGVPIASVAIALSPLPPRLADVVSRPLIKLAIGDIGRLGLRESARGPLAEIAACGRIPLLDHGTLRLIRARQIEVLGEVTGLDETSVHFRDGSSREIDAIIAATGFRSGLEQLLEPAERPSPVGKGRHSAADQSLHWLRRHGSGDVPGDRNRSAPDCTSDRARESGPSRTRHPRLTPFIARSVSQRDHAPLRLAKALCSRLSGTPDAVPGFLIDGFHLEST
jgi:indole-3-pyruvate monooxygenase